MLPQRIGLAQSPFHSGLVAGSLTLAARKVGSASRASVDCARYAFQLTLSSGVPLGCSVPMKLIATRPGSPTSIAGLLVRAAPGGRMSSGAVQFLPPSRDVVKYGWRSSATQT